MTVLIDTNVVLDVLLKREQFLEKSSNVMLLSEKKIIDGYITASAVTDIFYIVIPAIQPSDFLAMVLR